MSDSSYCTVCDIDFGTSRALVNHMQESGYPCNKPMVQCSFCQSFWPNSKSLKLHQEKNQSCIRLQEKWEENTSVFCKIESSEKEKNQISVHQHVNNTAPKFARNEITTYLPFAQTVPYAGSFADRKCSATQDTTNKDHIASGSCQSNKNNYLPAKTTHPTLDKFVINHLTRVMEEIGYGGLLMSRSKSSVHGPTKIPSFDEMKHHIQSSLMDPLYGLSRTNRKYDVADGSMVMDILVNSSSSEEDEDMLVDISEEEIVQFVRTQVNLDFDENSSQESMRLEGGVDHEQEFVYDVDEDDVEIEEDIVLVDIENESHEGIQQGDRQEPQVAMIDRENNTIVLSEYQNYIHSYRQRQIYRGLDRANLELYHLLTKCHAPVYMFDAIQSWSQRNSASLSQSLPVTRSKFIENMETKVHGRYSEAMKPRVEPIQLSSGRQTAITTFSFEMGLISKLTDKELMKPENLLIDPEDPFKLPDYTDFYGEVNTGSWHRNAYINLCQNPEKDFMIPLGIFVDAVNGDKYGHHSLEPVVVVPLIFKRAIRNQARSWFTIGYVETLKTNQVMDDEDDGGYAKNITSFDKIQDYHDMMTHILKDMVRIQEGGGIEMTLTIGDKSFTGTAKLPVQFVIGDCKGNDILCGRYGSHGEKVKHLVRDCDIQCEDADNPDHVCRYFTEAEVQGWTVAQCKEMSFHKIRNAFWNVSFGGDEYGIYGSTPPEPLHVFQMGLCVYLVEEFLRDIYTSTSKLIDVVVAKIVSSQSRQSHRGFPSLSTFRNGFTNLGTITGKEKYARIFVLYLALMTEEVANSVSTARGRGAEYPPLGADCAKNWLKLLEATLGIGQWFKKVRHPKDTIDTMILNPGEESLAQAACRRYLQLFKDVVNRQVGNGLCIVKYHHILHFCWYIQRYGCIPNFDGSRPEGIAKINTKDKFMLTQKQLSTENYQTACRLYESEIVEVACNEINSRSSATADANIEVARPVANRSAITNFDRVAGSKFVMALWFDGRGGIDDDEARYNLDVTWTKTKASLTLDDNLVESIVRRLFLHKGSGGCLMPDSKVVGFTEYKMNGSIFRCHPSYRSGKPWRDWAMMQPNPANNEHIVPCQILMLLDLSDSILMTRQQHKRFCNDRDPALPEDEWSDTLSYTSSSSSEEDSSVSSLNRGVDLIRRAEDGPSLSLTNGLWCVVHTTQRQDIADDQLASPNHFESRISTRFKLTGNLRILPIECIKGTCFVINASRTGASEYVFVVDDKSLWCEETFLEQNNQ